MKRRLAAAAIVAALILGFLIVNRGAYRGYFSDDDLDNIGWTRNSQLKTFAVGIVTPRYYSNHFRPVGHLTFHVWSRLAGLHYRPYIGTIHTLHLLNTLLVWLLLRKLAFQPPAALAGTIFFLFPMMAFDAIWRPMYVFDLWCCFFSLLCLLQWISGRWLLSFVCFWLAYKSKEHAVMIPFVLAAYEMLLGEKRWKQLIPFFAAAISFSLQGVFMNHGVGAAYRLDLSLPALIKTSSFYLSHILIYPYLGFLLFALPQWAPERRTYFGLAGALLLLAPMLTLPGRLFAAYLYVPLIFIAIAMAAWSARFHWAWTVAAFALWLPVNFNEMRIHRKAVITYAQENEAYVNAIRELPKQFPNVSRFIYDRYPQDLHPWGIQGALSVAYQRRDIELYSVEEKGLTEKFAAGSAALLIWDQPTRSVLAFARQEGQPDESYITMTRTTPIWQMLSGWNARDNNFRWTGPVATARLWRPPGARKFEVKVNVGPEYIRQVKRAELHVSLDGKEIGVAEFTAWGWKTNQFDLPEAPAGTVKVEFRTEPPLQPVKTDPELLGSAIGGFGFR